MDKKISTCGLMNNMLVLFPKNSYILSTCLHQHLPKYCITWTQLFSKFWNIGNTMKLLKLKERVWLIEGEAKDGQTLCCWAATLLFMTYYYHLLIILMCTMGHIYLPALTLPCITREVVVLLVWSAGHWDTSYGVVCVCVCVCMTSQVKNERKKSWGNQKQESNLVSSVLLLTYHTSHITYL